MYCNNRKVILTSTTIKTSPFNLYNEISNELRSLFERKIKQSNVDNVFRLF